MEFGKPRTEHLHCYANFNAPMHSPVNMTFSLLIDTELFSVRLLSMTSHAQLNTSNGNLPCSHVPVYTMDLTTFPHKKKEVHFKCDISLPFQEMYLLLLCVNFTLYLHKRLNKSAPTFSLPLIASILNR